MVTTFTRSSARKTLAIRAVQTGELKSPRGPSMVRTMQTTSLAHTRDFKAVLHNQRHVKQHMAIKSPFRHGDYKYARRGAEWTECGGGYSGMWPHENPNNKLQALLTWIRPGCDDSATPAAHSATSSQSEPAV